MENNKEKNSNITASSLYRYNKYLEIVLVIISVLVINFLFAKELWIWAGLFSLIMIFLEILLKSEAMNPFIKMAQQREVKQREYEEQGIRNLYFMRDSYSKHRRNEAIIEIIRNSNELNLLAETGNSYISPTADRFWKEIKKKIDNGVKLKLLLVDPLCENKKLRNEFNDIEGVDSKFNFKQIKELSNHPHVTIRFTNETYCSLFFTDHSMIYDPYHIGKIGDRIENNFIAIEFSRTNENYNILKNHFENCWETGHDINKVEDELKKINFNI